jgi:N4-gp56 family major capsid protein
MATIIAGTATSPDQSLGAAVQKQVDRNLIPNLRGELVMAAYARPGRLMPGTNQLMLLEVPDLSSDTSYLSSEVTNPAAEALQLNTITVSTNEIGRAIQISRRARNVSAYDVATTVEERLRFDANRRIETELANAGKVSGTARYSGSASTRATVSATASFADLRKANVKLASAFAPKFNDNTRKALLHPYAIGDLMAETNAGSWVDANKYATPEEIKRGVWGKTIYGVEVVEFDYAPVFAAAGASSADVYAGFILGNQAIAAATIEDLRVQVVPTTPDHADFIGRTFIASYYMDFGAGAVKSTWYVRFETAVTAL